MRHQLRELLSRRAKHSKGGKVITKRQARAGASAYAGSIALVIDCSGHEQAVLDACKVVRKRGEVVLVGVPWKANTGILAHEILHAVFFNFVVLRSGWEWDVPVLARAFVWEELYDGYNNAPHSTYTGLAKALKWLSEGRVPVDGLVRSQNPSDRPQSIARCSTERSRSRSWCSTGVAACEWGTGPQDNGRCRHHARQGIDQPLTGVGVGAPSPYFSVNTAATDQQATISGTPRMTRSKPSKSVLAVTRESHLDQHGGNRGNQTHGDSGVMAREDTGLFQLAQPYSAMGSATNRPCRLAPAWLLMLKCFSQFHNIDYATFISYNLIFPSYAKYSWCFSSLRSSHTEEQHEVQLQLLLPYISIR
ncbi:hypothetical protein X741_30960 [Mesorhizobium sp. LNHC229A00]|nr:hypothetical protein X741_30960 [Mesorhizobium sp. LNHC229A00]